eukprot:200821_1
MKPYSFTTNANAQQIITQKGNFLKSKTKTIIIEPIPLHWNESHVIKLIRNIKNTKNDDNYNNFDIITHIEFERDSNREIYKKVYIEFNNETNANKYVKLLNKKSYEKHVLSVTWTKMRNTKEFLKKSFYLKCVGFPLDITKNKILQFLYQHKIEPKQINVIFKYALITQVFMQFNTIKQSVNALQITKGLIYKHKNKQFELYSRYATHNEYEKAVEYKHNIKQMND